MEPILEHERAILVQVDNLVLIYATGDPPESFDEFTRAIARVARGYPKGVFVMIAVRADAPPPSDVGKRSLQEFYTEVGPHLIALCQVLEGEGFVAAAKRGAVSLITLLARLPFPLGVRGDVDQGISWLRSHGDDCPSPMEIHDAVTYCQKRLESLSAVS